MKSDMPMRIWFGGNCCVPIACRSRESTITMRVKLVIMIRIAGASDRTVSRMMICMPAEKFSRLVMSGMLKVGGGAGGVTTDGSGLRESEGTFPIVSWARTGEIIAKRIATTMTWNVSAVPARAFTAL